MQENLHSKEMLFLCLNYAAICNLYDYLIRGNFYNLVIWAANAAGDVKREDAFFGPTGFSSDYSAFSDCVS